MRKSDYRTRWSLSSDSFNYLSLISDCNIIILNNLSKVALSVPLKNSSLTILCFFWILHAIFRLKINIRYSYQLIAVYSFILKNFYSAGGVKVFFKIICVYMSVPMALMVKPKTLNKICLQSKDSSLRLGEELAMVMRMPISHAKDIFPIVTKLRVRASKYFVMLLP